MFLNVLFELLNKNNLKYTVLRNYEKLPVSVGSSDLDILIASDNVELFYVLLQDALDKVTGKVIIKYGAVTPRLCILCKDTDGWFGLQIDVHEGSLPYKSNNMFPADFVLERSRVHNGVFVTDDLDSNLIAFLKEIFNNGTCKKRIFDGAKLAWHKNNKIYIPIFENIYGKKFVNVFISELSKDYENAGIKKIAKIGISHLNHDTHTKLKNLKSGFVKLYRFIKPPGLTIAFLGVDGAGKSTIIDKVKPALTLCVHNSLYYEHMRPNLIPNIAQLLGKPVMDGAVINPHSKKTSGLLGSLVRLIYYSFDYIFGYWFKVYPVMVKKSTIWLFDRYYYDYLIDHKRARIKLPIWIIEIVRLFIPKPDLIFCLGTNPEIIYDRKPELTLDEITIQTERLKKFCSSENSAVWIDTGGDIDNTVNEVFIEIGRRFDKK